LRADDSHAAVADKAGAPRAVAIALASVVALTAAAAEPLFLGSQSCATSLCHGGADPQHNQNLIWSTRDAHTRAPATLTITRSARLAETLKIADATVEPGCTVCHNPFQAVPASRKGPQVRSLEGVSCESCHNAAEPWLLTHTRTDLSHAEKVAAGLRDLKDLYVRANTCVACHQNLEPRVRAAGHPELIFELDGQCAAMPRHWMETNRVRGAQAWLTGQAVALREASVQLEGKPGSEIDLRANALAWLLGTAGHAPPGKIAAEAKQEVHAWADGVAKTVAAQNWSREEAQALLRKMAGASADFERADAGALALAYRAERLVLGLDRLTAAAGATNAAINSGLNALFRDAQSRPDFEAKKFAADLRRFDAALQ